MERLRIARARGAVAPFWLALFGLALGACAASGVARPPVPTHEPVVVNGRAFASVNDAIARARPSDTIELPAGVYVEQIDVTKPLTIEPAGDGDVWIDGGCDLQNGIHITADNVTVRGIGIRRSDEAGVRIDAADDITLERLTIQDWNCADEEDQFRAGIASWDGGRNLTVRDSHLERRVDLHGPADGYGNGIWVKNSGPSDGGGHLIEGNTIIGGFDGIGGEPENEEWGGFHRDTAIQDNTIIGCSDDGIQVEGGTEDVLVQRNEVRGCLVGIAIAPALDGPLTIVRNVIIEPRPHRGEGPAMIKVGDGSTGEVLIYHNSFFSGETPADGVKQTNEGVSNIHFRNNAVYTGRYVIETGDETGFDFDYDALSTSDPEKFVVWNGEMLGDLGALREAAEQEVHGITTHDFTWDESLRPLAGSPLIDRGVVIPGVNDDYAGAAPDIGAFEFGANE